MTTRSRYTAAITDKPWWLAGGIPSSACVAAYQPVGASDYASSKVNLANPGTYNCADGAAYPTWAVTTGWTFSASSSQYLSTGIIPIAQQYSMILRFANASANNNYFDALMGSWRWVSEDMFYITPNWNSSSVVWGVVSLQARSPAMTSGVLAIAANKCYRNGTLEHTAPTTVKSLSTILFGASRIASNFYSNGDVIAAAIYNATITDDQIASLTVAMNAL